MQTSAPTLPHRELPERGTRRVLVLLLAVIAVVVGLLTLHAPGAAAHGHGPGADAPAPGAGAGPAPHSHAAVPLGDTASAQDHIHAASDPSHLRAASEPDRLHAGSGPGSAECPGVGVTHCCSAAVACLPVLALLSAAQAPGAAPVALAGVTPAAVAAFSLRLAPVRPPSLAQLSTLRI